MVLSLLFNRNKYKKTMVDVIELDVSISEDHKYTSKVTSFPIENGTNVSDHIINLPEIVTIEGIVSDTPLNIFSLGNRSIDAFNSLVQIHRDKKIVTLVTGIKVYQNMVMTVLNVPRSLETGQSLTFNLEFQKVLLDSFVRTQLETASLFVDSTENIPRDTVAENTNYQTLKTDPPSSLKDQSSTEIDVGLQNLETVPPVNFGSFQTTARLIQGF